MNLVQISDTHFGTERPAVVRALINWMAQNPPDVLVLSGDITQRARRWQFHAARELLEQIPAKRFVSVPGNHDLPLFNLWQRFVRSYGSYHRDFGPHLEQVHDLPGLKLVCINTTRVHRHKDGEVSDDQRDWVTQQLRMAKAGQIKVVVAHHPFDVVLPGDVSNLVHGRMDAIREWSDAGLDLVMGGHIHYPFLRCLQLRYPELSRTPWVAQAGTAISHRVRNGKPNSFNRLIWSGAPERAGERASVQREPGGDRGTTQLEPGGDRGTTQLERGDDRATAQLERWDYHATAQLERWDYAETEQCFQRVEVHRPWAKEVPPARGGGQR